MLKSVRVPKSFLASYGSGKRSLPPVEEDDDLEFFDDEQPVVITKYRQFKTTLPASCSGDKWVCLWCFAPRTPDDRNRFDRCQCGRLGVTKLTMRDKKRVYIEEVEA